MALNRVTHWGSVKSFLEVARTGSFRAAAQNLGVSTNFMRKQISDLENSYNTTLMTRHIDGIRLTPEGERVLQAARKMEEAAFGIDRAFSQATPEMRGEIKIASVEGLGIFWLAPKLVDFQRGHPGLLVDLVCGSRSADVLRMEADLCIQVEEPTQPDVMRVRLGRLHLMPFVSPMYVEQYGIPVDDADLFENHHIVLQDAEQLRSSEVLAQHVPRDQIGLVTVRNNLSSAHLMSISSGAGVGWMSTYLAAFNRSLIPLDFGARFPLDIWLTFHPDAKRIPRVSLLIDWVVAVFDSRKYPWFRDEFVHPNDLMSAYAAEPTGRMFAVPPLATRLV